MIFGDAGRFLSRIGMGGGTLGKATTGGLDPAEDMWNSQMLSCGLRDVVSRVGMVDDLS